MRKVILILFCFLNLFKANCQNKTNNSLIEKKGWVVYLPDNNIIYVSGTNRQIRTTKAFFESLYYKNGVLLNGYKKIDYYKRMSDMYEVSDWKGQKKSKMIYILPVKTKIIEKPNIEATEIQYLTFYRNGKEIRIAFRILTNYEVVQIIPLRGLAHRYRG